MMAMVPEEEGLFFFPPPPSRSLTKAAEPPEPPELNSSERRRRTRSARRGRSPPADRGDPGEPQRVVEVSRRSKPFPVGRTVLRERVQPAARRRGAALATQQHPLVDENGKAHGRVEQRLADDEQPDEEEGRGLSPRRGRRRRPRRHRRSAWLPLPRLHTPTPSRALP